MRIALGSQVDTKVKGLTLPHVRNEGSDTSDSVRSVRPYILNHTFCGKNTKMLVFPLPFQNRHLESLYFWWGVGICDYLQVEKIKKLTTQI